MKRSEINQYIKEAKAIFEQYKFTLPPWAHFSPDEWSRKGAEFNEVRENMLGWDVTDFSRGEYEKVGRFPAIEEDELPLHLLCNEYPQP